MKKIISIFLAILILASSFNLTLAMHYCGGELADYAVQIGEADLGCGMEKMQVKNNCKSPFADMLSKMDDCCDDASFAVEIADDFSPSVAEFDFKSQNSQAQNNFLLAFTANFIAPYHHIFSLGANPKTDFKYYSSPLLEQDKQVLLQTFLL